MQTFTVNGVRIAATIGGTPGATPLVMLHSGGTGRFSWAEVAPAFAQTHHTVAVDLRGYGDSDWPGTYSFELMRDDVIGVLDQLGFERIDLVGHSMGGTVSWLIAQEQPERVTRLVIEDTPPPKPGSRRLELPATKPEGDLGHDWEAIVAVVGQLNDPDPRWWARLTEVTARTLVLAGGASSHVPQDVIAEAVTLVKDATLVEIPVGHHVHRDAFDRYMEVVVPFLTGQEWDVSRAG
ncbi:MAG: alpha/beta hydrolase [Hamadaea sp.]|nr:alpha/beta hydrolase [Hamadaea sp.]